MNTQFLRQVSENAGMHVMAVSNIDFEEEVGSRNNLVSLH